MAAHQPCVSSLTIFQKATQSYSCCGLVRGQYEITGFSAFFLLLYRSVLNGEKIPPHERARRTEYWCTVFIHGGSVLGWAWCCMLGAPLNTTRGRAQLVVPACRAMWKCPGMCLPGSRRLWPQGNVLWVGLCAGTALLGAACASAGQPSLLYWCTGIFFSVAWDILSHPALGTCKPNPWYSLSACTPLVSVFCLYAQSAQTPLSMTLFPAGVLCSLQSPSASWVPQVTFPIPSGLAWEVFLPSFFFIFMALALLLFPCYPLRGEMSVLHALHDVTYLLVTWSLKKKVILHYQDFFFLICPAYSPASSVASLGGQWTGVPMPVMEYSTAVEAARNLSRARSVFFWVFFRGKQP